MYRCLLYTVVQLVFVCQGNFGVVTSHVKKSSLLFSKKNYRYQCIGKNIYRKLISLYVYFTFYIFFLFLRFPIHSWTNLNWFSKKFFKKLLLAKFAARKMLDRSPLTWVTDCVQLISLNNILTWRLILIVNLPSIQDKISC